MAVPIGERLDTPTASVHSEDESSFGSDSASQPSSDSSDSTPGPRQRVRRLTRRIILSNPKEASEETEDGIISIDASEFSALRVPSDTSLTQAVTTLVFHRSQVETNEAAASGASPVIVWTSTAWDRLSGGQQGRISPEINPHRAQASPSDDPLTSSRPATPSGSSRVDWTPRESGFDWAPIETDSWEKFEEVAQQVAQGAAKKTIDYAVDMMGLLRTNIDDQMERRTENL